MSAFDALFHSLYIPQETTYNKTNPDESEQASIFLYLIS
jgi:hypothetical protein